jgi:hypothetical protein
MRKLQPRLAAMRRACLTTFGKSRFFKGVLSYDVALVVTRTPSVYASHAAPGDCRSCVAGRMSNRHSSTSLAPKVRKLWVTWRSTDIAKSPLNPSDAQTGGIPILEVGNGIAAHPCHQGKTDARDIYGGGAGSCGATIP